MCIAFPDLRVTPADMLLTTICFHSLQTYKLQFVLTSRISYYQAVGPKGMYAHCDTASGLAHLLPDPNINSPWGLSSPSVSRLHPNQANGWNNPCGIAGWMQKQSDSKLSDSTLEWQLLSSPIDHLPEVKCPHQPQCRIRPLCRERRVRCRLQSYPTQHCPVETWETTRT